MLCNEDLKIYFFKNPFNVLNSNMYDIFKLRRGQNSRTYSQFMIAVINRRDILVLVQRAFQISLPKEVSFSCWVQKHEWCILKQRQYWYSNIPRAQKCIGYFLTIVENGSISGKIWFSSDFSQHFPSLRTLPSKEGNRTRKWCHMPLTPALESHRQAYLWFQG